MQHPAGTDNTISLAADLIPSDTEPVVLRGVMYDDAVPNKRFTGSGPAQPYLNHGLLGLLNEAPEGSKGAALRKQVRMVLIECIKMIMGCFILLFGVPNVVMLSAGGI